MIIDHESKFIFVAVAKTACTSIHRSFEITQDPEPNIYHMHLKDIIKTNPEAKGYFKFGFVRNPYDRLVSAYHDFKHCEGHQSWAHPIQKYKTKFQIQKIQPKNKNQNSKNHPKNRNIKLKNKTLK